MSNRIGTVINTAEGTVHKTKGNLTLPRFYGIKKITVNAFYRCAYKNIIKKPPFVSFAMADNFVVDCLRLHVFYVG